MGLFDAMFNLNLKTAEMSKKIYKSKAYFRKLLALIYNNCLRLSIKTCFIIIFLRFNMVFQELLFKV